MCAAQPSPLWQKAVAGLTAGGLGALVGSPADLSLIRMQADATVPLAQRRNYKGVGDAMVRMSVLVLLVDTAVCLFPGCTRRPPSTPQPNVKVKCWTNCRCQQVAAVGMPSYQCHDRRLCYVSIDVEQRGGEEGHAV